MINLVWAAIAIGNTALCIQLPLEFHDMQK